MKQTDICRSLLSGAVLLAAAVVSPPASAEVLLNEDFSTYTLGNLYNQNGWIHHTTQTIQNDPIQITAKAMDYAGFANATQAAQIFNGTETTQEKLKKQFRDKTDSTEPLYYAALVNLSEVPTNTRASYFLAFMTANANADAGLIDQKGGNEYGRIFAYQSPDDASKIRFGLSKNATTMGDKLESREFDLNTTVLLVCKWEYVEGTTNDVYKVWVNPVKSETEPDADLNTDYGADPILGTGKLPIQGIEIRQGRTSSKDTPSGFVGPVRVATSWAELWGEGEGPAPVKTPKISSNASKVEFPASFQGSQALVAGITVKGEALEGDVTVGGLSSVVASASVIAKEEAMSPEGYTLTLTLPCDEALNVSETLTLSSEGAKTLEIPVKGNVLAVIEKNSLSGLNNLPETDDNIYRYTGKAIVTYYDPANETLYAQDGEGGIKINLENYYGTQVINRGDEITSLVCAYDGMTYGGGAVYPVGNEIATVISSGNDVEPIAVSLSELNADKAKYMSRLVQIADVTFTSYSEGAKITTAQTPVSSKGATGAVRAFPGSSALNMAMPQSAPAVTGISTSKTAAVISLRDAEGIETAAPDIKIESEKLYGDDYEELGKSIVHTKYTVTASNLKSPVSIWLGGTGRTHYSLDTEEIPAGTSTTVVTVSYAPAKTGKHTAMVNFDVSPAELSQSFSITAKAWDPANPPTVTVDASGLTKFEANCGEKATQTLTYTSAGLLDWGKVRVEGKSNGAFTINTTSLLKNNTAGITVTFAPTAVGEYTEDIIFSADKMEPITVTVTGTATNPEVPEERQGDDLAFDTSNPLKLVSENFENCGEHNNALAITGWKNVAVQGTRAWWAYKFEETGNTAAKVTPYDSKASEDTPCEMLLLSPALDFKNAGSRLLGFSLMGEFLGNDPDAVLDVCYIDVVDGEPYYEAIGGLNVPVSSDYNGEWIPYVVDLEGLELADTFFIGFRYRSSRGVNHSATYYVDDFSWGSTDVPFIRTDVKEITMAGEAGKDLEAKLTVNPQGLTGDIVIELSGADAGLFSVTPSVLPAVGGTVTVTYVSQEAAESEATLRLSSAGAPDCYVALKASTVMTSVNGIVNDAAADVYTIEGVCIGRGMTRSEALKTLPAGIYIFGNEKLIIR